DYTATQITNAPAGNIAAVTVQAALNELDTEKQGKSLTGYTIATAISAINPADTVLAALGKLEYKIGQRLKATGAQISTSNVTLTNIAPLAMSVIAGKTYKILTTIDFQSTAAATGITLGLAASGGAVGTLAGTIKTLATAAASNSIFSGPITALGGLVTSPTVPVANTTYQAIIEATFVCTTAGQIIPQFRSETGTQVQINASSNTAIFEVA
ncbi:MAG: hypothetical protein ACRCYP_02315, partial [Alphaproteobacteria bacterium]